MASNKAWNNIFRDYKINDHDFDNGPFELTADQIKKILSGFYCDRRQGAKNTVQTGYTF